MRLHILYFASLCASFSIIPRQSSPCESGIFLCCIVDLGILDDEGASPLEKLAALLGDAPLFQLTCMNSLPFISAVISQHPLNGFIS